MWSSPEGYGSISSTYVLDAASGAAGLGVRDREGRSAAQTACHFASTACRVVPLVLICSISILSRIRKSLSDERLVGVVAASAACSSLGYVRSCSTCRNANRHESRLCSTLFPDSAALDGPRLTVGGLAADELAAEFGTPLVVLCEETIRGTARALREAVGDGRVFFGTKALPNVALLRVLREEGVGADVASAGELAFAVAAGLEGGELVVHGNNKEAAFLGAAARTGAPVVLDAPDEAALAAEAGVRQALVRVTLGVDADTHEAIRTGHHGSKFGLPPDQARAAVAEALERGLDVIGVHVHVGSQLADFDAQAETIVRLASFVASCRDELGWTARSLISEAASGSATTPRTTCPRRTGSRRVRRRRRASHSSRRGCPSPRSGSSRGAASSAGPV